MNSVSNTKNYVIISIGVLASIIIGVLIYYLFLKEDSKSQNKSEDKSGDNSEDIKPVDKTINEYWNIDQISFIFMNFKPITDGIKNIVPPTEDCLLLNLQNELNSNNTDSIKLNNISNLLGKYTSSSAYFCKAFYDISMEINKNSGNIFSRNNVIDPTTILTEKNINDILINILKEISRDNPSYKEDIDNYIKATESEIDTNMKDLITKSLLIDVLYSKVNELKISDQNLLDFEELKDELKRVKTTIYSTTMIDLFKLSSSPRGDRYFLLTNEKLKRSKLYFFDNQKNIYYELRKSTKILINQKLFDLRIENSNLVSCIFENQ